MRKRTHLSGATLHHPLNEVLCYVCVLDVCVYTTHALNLYGVTPGKPANATKPLFIDVAMSVLRGSEAGSAGLVPVGIRPFQPPSLVPTGDSMIFYSCLSQEKGESQEKEEGGEDKGHFLHLP